MADAEQLAPIETGLAEEKETILIIGPDGNPVQRLRRELQSGGYRLLTATGSSEAIRLLSTRRVQLIIVSAHSGKHIAPEEKPGQSASTSKGPAAHGESQQPESYRLCQEVKAAAAEIPTLLICSLWDESALVRGLGSEADYVLFAPYQSADLQRAVRDTLLNGPVREPENSHSAIEIVHHDRRHAVGAGRSQLARLCFSIFEELRQCRASLSWSQSEVQDLRRQLRQERQQSQRVLQSPAVVQGIAHDFSNLLETVSAAATVLRSGPPQPKPYRDALDAALAQAGVLLSTLQKWTEWEGEGEREPAYVEAIDLASTAQDALDAALLALRAPNIQVRLQLQGLPPVSASRPLMMRILSNLIWNAVEAMPRGGRLSLLGYLQRNRVVLEVSDTGVGISKQQQEKIFKTHCSTKQGHAGMGLLLVHSLVERAGGHITFVSNPGRGSTFALSFAAASRVITAEPWYQSRSTKATAKM